MPVPRYEELFNPLLAAIRNLGGSGSISELGEEVTRALHISEADLAEPHNERITELQYRLAWARTYLKAYGLLGNSERGVWVLTSKGKDVDAVNPRDVSRFVRALSRNKKTPGLNNSPATFADVKVIDIAEAVLEETWREELLGRLRALAPDAFERLCQRLLRESGFVEVKVTGRSGDGGIDGVGIVRLGGLLGFPVLFQCKRYQGSVGADAIRDFRGAMIGRADRGLFLTTGTFSRDARMEATRDGAPPIDLSGWRTANG